jgi:uncharacterized protein YprB with RNaseH-like and TPR domain
VESLELQLAWLRERLVRTDEKYDGGAVPAPERDPRRGHEVETASGRHWVMEKSWPAHARHGTVDIGGLSELPDDTLATLTSEAGFVHGPLRWAFLDTETTGLAGGTGTAAFLVGVGAITPDGFLLKQFFMRDHGEEASLLEGVSEFLAGFDVLVTYNGKAFDQPLLENRYRLARMDEPFPRLQHLDLLFSARRLWRLALERCRLQDLEKRILGVERQGDPGGDLIPNLYFSYLRDQQSARLEPVFEHNAIDIVSLACLTAIVPLAFREPFAVARAAEMVGLGKWLRSQGRLEEALRLLRAALSRPLDDSLVWLALWEAGEIERKLGRVDGAVAAWAELSTVGNPYRARALERLAIHYEHKEKNPAMALEMTRAARAIEDSTKLANREARLARRTSLPRTPRLL